MKTFGMVLILDAPAMAANAVFRGYWRCPEWQVLG